MHAHGVHVLDEADGDHLVLGVADDLQLQLLPAEHRFLDQDLADQAGGEAAAGDHAQLLDVVDQAAAGAAHGVGRAGSPPGSPARRRRFSASSTLIRPARCAACRCPAGSWFP